MGGQGRGVGCWASRRGGYNEAMIGILIIDHGSRRPEANAQLHDMANRVAVRLPPGTRIALAHLDVSAPTIADGVATLLSQGVDDLLVLLYFLADGTHVSVDIPAQVRAALASRPDVRVTIGGALGPDDALAGLMLRRVGL
jgi:sirohydrochlorin ferrochelatase